MNRNLDFVSVLQVLAGKSQLVLNPLFQITVSLFILKSVNSIYLLWKICWPKPCHYFGGKALRNFRGVVGIVGSMWDDIFDCTRLVVPSALWRVPNRFVKNYNDNSVYYPIRQRSLTAYLFDVFCLLFFFLFV